MKKTIIYALFGSLIFLGSCNKNKLPEIEASESPVFYLKGLVNDIPINIQAGIQDYSMQSSYYLDSNLLYVYKSEFDKKCAGANCGYEFSILINDDRYTDATNTSMDVENTLRPGDYQFGLGNSDPIYYQGTFTPLNSSGTCTWSFGDGMSITASVATKTMEAKRPYSVNLYKEQGSCNASLDNTFLVGDPNQTQISAVNLGGNKYAFSATTGNDDPYEYEWDFQEGPIVRDKNPEHTFSSNNRYYVTLKLTDASKNVCTMKYMIAPKNSCDANFTSVFTPIPNKNALSKVTLLAKDPSGKIHSSNEIQQMSDSKFQIVSVEDYKTNQDGHKTKKIKINFSCVLKDGSNTITIKNGEAVIAVAYK